MRFHITLVLMPPPLRAIILLDVVVVGLGDLVLDHRASDSRIQAPVSIINKVFQNKFGILVVVRVLSHLDSHFDIALSRTS